MAEMACLVGAAFILVALIAVALVMGNGSSSYEL
jgi:hypothetical protein